MAAERANLSTLRFLKEKGADVHVTDDGYNNALHLAIINHQSTKKIEWLIDVAGIPVDSLGAGDRTPFLEAAASGHVPALKLLEAKGAKVDAIDYLGMSA